VSPGKQTTQGTHDLKTRSTLSRQVVPLIAVSVGLPILVLAGVGLYFVFQQGYLLVFVAVLAVVTLLARLLLWWLNRNLPKTSLQAGESIVEPSEDWSDSEQEIWVRINGEIDLRMHQNDDWNQLQTHAIEIVRLAADEYECTEWDFSIPASLRMLEEVSRRYRKTLRTHVPFVEAVKVSHLRYAFQNQENLGRAHSFYRVSRNVWRGIRLLNPVAAVVSEVRDYITGELFAKVNAETQWQLKKALLQEVLSVSIDLYSGRFNIDESDLDTATVTKADQSRLAPPLDPVRIAVLGQQNSGKSSLINALRGEFNAEVDALPVDRGVRVYTYSIDDVEHLHLVELPGLNGDAKAMRKLVSQLVESDIVLWVLKADQPARSLDTRLHEQFEAHFDGRANLQKKKPVLIGLLNHVDALSPRDQWIPPYDLADTGIAKVRTINEALQYNQQQIPFQALVPLCLAPDKPHYNLSSVVDAVETNFQTALQVQLNRRGREARERGRGLTEQGQRLLQTGKSLFAKVVKEAKS